jgi:uncharacterized LabA/DUF88 family protein
MSSAFPKHLERHGGRVMLFVDGENMAARYQAALGKADPADHVVATQDVFVWSNVINSFLEKFNVVRTYYFTSATGDEKRLGDLADEIRSHGFEAPRVYKRSKGRGSKRVDIAMASEMLIHGFRNNFETAFVVTGDEDFVPAVEAISSLGKRVVLWYVSPGISESLKRASHHTFDLTDVLLSSGEHPWRLMRGGT